MMESGNSVIGNMTKIKRPIESQAEVNNFTLKVELASGSLKTPTRLMPRDNYDNDDEDAEMLSLFRICMNETKLIRGNLNKPPVKVGDVRVELPPPPSVAVTIPPTMQKRKSITESTIPDKKAKKDEEPSRGVKCGECKETFEDYFGLMDHVENDHIISKTSKGDSDAKKLKNPEEVEILLEDDDKIEETAMPKKKSGPASRIEFRTHSGIQNTEQVDRNQAIKEVLPAVNKKSSVNVEGLIIDRPVNEDRAPVTVVNQVLDTTGTSDHNSTAHAQEASLDKSDHETGDNLLTTKANLEANVSDLELLNVQSVRLKEDLMTSGARQSSKGNNDDSANIAGHVMNATTDEKRFQHLKQEIIKILELTDEDPFIHPPPPPPATNLNLRNCFVALVGFDKDFPACVKCSLCNLEFTNDGTILRHVNKVHLISDDDDNNAGVAGVSEEQRSLRQSEETRKVEMELGDSCNNLTMFLSEAFEKPLLPFPGIQGLAEISAALAKCDRCDEVCLDSPTLKEHVLLAHLPSVVDEKEGVILAPTAAKKKRGRPRKNPAPKLPEKPDTDPVEEVVILDCPDCEARFFDEQLLREHEVDAHAGPEICDDISVIYEGKTCPNAQTVAKAEQKVTGNGTVAHARPSIVSTEEILLHDKYKHLVKPCSVVLRRLNSESVVSWPPSQKIAKLQTGQTNWRHKSYSFPGSKGDAGFVIKKEGRVPEPTASKVETDKQKKNRSSLSSCLALGGTENAKSSETETSIEGNASKPKLRLVPMEKLLKSPAMTTRSEPNIHVSSRTAPPMTGQTGLRRVQESKATIGTPTHSDASFAKPSSVSLTRPFDKENRLMTRASKAIAVTPSPAQSSKSGSGNLNIRPTDVTANAQVVHSDVQSLLNSHVDESIRCGSCSKVFNNRADVLTHIEKVHQNPGKGNGQVQAKSSASAKCIHDRCSLSFLSANGLESHMKKCKGFAIAGNFVVCPTCGDRYRNFSTMSKHHLKAHGGIPMSQVDANISATEPIKNITTASTQFSTLQSEERREVLRQRILEESRCMSKGRGRPRKNHNIPSKLNIEVDIGEGSNMISSTPTGRFTRSNSVNKSALNLNVPK